MSLIYHKCLGLYTFSKLFITFSGFFPTFFPFHVLLDIKTHPTFSGQIFYFCNSCANAALLIKRREFRKKTCGHPYRFGCTRIDSGTLQDQGTRICAQKSDTHVDSGTKFFRVDTRKSLKPAPLLPEPTRNPSIGLAIGLYNILWGKGGGLCHLPNFLFGPTPPAPPPPPPPPIVRS